MQEIEGAYHAAASLYSIAFLLTGRSELSLEITMEVLDSEDDPELLLSSQALAGLRRTVIEKALAAIRGELALSERQTVSLPFAEACLPPSTWSLDPNTTKLQIESALLAIDVFPRCALLLTVFEGLNLQEASALLGSNGDSTLKGRMAGLWNFTYHLARMQGWNPSAIQFPPTSFELGSRSLWSES